MLGPEGRKQLRALGDVGTIGLEIFFTLLIFIGGGRKLDEWFDTKPWIGTAGIVLGLLAVGRIFYRVAKRTKEVMSEKTTDSDSTDDQHLN